MQNQPNVSLAERITAVILAGRKNGASEIERVRSLDAELSIADSKLEQELQAVINGHAARRLRAVNLVETLARRIGFTPVPTANLDPVSDRAPAALPDAERHYWQHMAGHPAPDLDQDFPRIVRTPLMNGTT